MRSNVMLALALAIAATTTAGPAAAQARSGSGGAIEIPLREHAGRLYLPVMTAGGTELALILSTGSEWTILSETGAKKAGDNPKLTLSDLAVPMEESQTIPDASFTFAGRVFDGMIGSNVLNQFDMLVDMPRGRLVLKPAGRSVSWEGVTLSDPIMLRIFHGFVLSTDVEVNGNRYPAMLELGTPSLLSNERVITEAAIEDGRAARVRLAGATYANLPISVSDNAVIGRFSPNGDGFLIVGASLAMDCAISVSWTHAELRTCVR